MTAKNILIKSSKELKNACIETANLDARVLLEYIIELDSGDIFSHPEMPLTNSQYSKFRRLLNRRKKGEPVAYLTGHKEFYGHDFFVNKNVLIPRPETELLVEQAIEFIECHCDEFAKKQSRLPQPNPPAGGRLRNDRKKSIDIIDIGTGSGCIIISLCKQFLTNKLKSCFLIPTYHASDISPKALYIARNNAKLHRVDKEIKFYNSNLFANKRMSKKYDIIIANLPYVPLEAKTCLPDFDELSRIAGRAKQLKARSLKFEPKNSIFAENNGTKIIKQFLDQAKDKISKNGLILIELDPRNAKELRNYATKIFSKSKIDLTKDLAKLDRVIRILNI